MGIKRDEKKMEPVTFHQQMYDRGKYIYTRGEHISVWAS